MKRLLALVALLIVAACGDATPMTNPSPSPSAPAPTATPPATATQTASPTATPAATPVTHGPLWTLPSAERSHPLPASDPTNPARVAYCAPGAIQVSHDGGSTWTAIPTAGVAPLAMAAGYPLFADEQQEPACLQVTLAAKHPDSYFALFPTAHADDGAPPIYFMGYLTTDAGETWQPVPIPPDGAADRFGGFRASGSVVQARFLAEPAPDAGPETPPAFIVTESTDGGEHWQPSTLTCPAVGPCVQWGPAPAMITGMGAPRPQWVLHSTDEGQTWDAPAEPLTVDLHARAPGQLIGMAPDTVVLLAGQEPEPRQVSKDGGKTWQPMPLPPLPNMSPGEVVSYPGLMMLPDGALLTYPPTPGPWLLLAPEAAAWCTITNADLPEEVTPLQVSGDRLWWIEGGGGFPATTPPTPHSLPLSDLACGG